MKKVIEIIEYVQSLFPKPVYLVGGSVRDYLLEIEPKDYDFCSALTTDEIKECLKGKHRAYLTGQRFGTIGFKALDQDIEITTFRKETYENSSRKPEVEYVNSLNEDLSRRDFTINSICMRIVKGHIRIIDPFNGAEDLEKGIIRCVGSPKQRLKEDPLRMLRAIRFANRFENFSIHPDTYKKIQSGAISILNISKERWMIELNKILMCDRVGMGLWQLWDTKLFNYMIPELSLQFNYDQNSQYHAFKLHEHTIKVVEACPKDINLRWAGLLHDVAKPIVRTEKLVDVGVSMTVPKVIKEKQNGEYIEVVVNGELNSISGNLKANYIGHEVLGADMVRKLAQHLNWSKERTEVVVKLVRDHLKDDCPLREYDNEGKK